MWQLYSLLEPMKPIYDTDTIRHRYGDTKKNLKLKQVAWREKKNRNKLVCVILRIKRLVLEFVRL